MRTLWTKSWIKLTGLAVFILFFSCAGSPPENLGVQGGLMAPVPPSPNAVSTQAPMDDKIHFIEPIPYDGNPQEFRRLVIQVLESWEGATLVKAEGPVHLRHVPVQTHGFRGRCQRYTLNRGGRLFCTYRSAIQGRLWRSRE
jgi:hypothetical protein